ncbi:MAG TPA: FAD-dependent oxidoreductase [Ktedonobacteraceae bacterium]|nr:FAD-dependent oxidoreductase [Ktedonobacteraceae bacterium]
MSQSIRADVLVIGAGIMGASCALRLSERGLHVAVLEAQSAPAMGSTGRSAAGVRIQYTEEVNIRISWQSIQEYQHFQELYGEDAGYRPVGYLFLVPPEQWSEHLESVALQQRLGAPVHVLSPEAAQDMIAFDASGIAGVTHGPVDGIVDPHSVTFTYLRLAKERGASVYTDTPLISAKRAGNSWQAETPKGSFEAPYLVNAAGAWAGEVARRAGLAAQVPVQPIRRIVYMTAPTPWQHVYPLTIDLTSGFYLRSEGQRILFGKSNPDEPPGFTEGVDWDWLEPTISVGIERFPWLEETRLDSQACWWGYYEVTPDHNPILGRLPGVENWINVTGFSGHGVQQAPAIGQLIAEEVVLGRAQSINIDPLRITRFATNQQSRERNII